MSIDVTTEKRFEADIEEFFLSSAGGYTHNYDGYDPQLGVYKDTLLRFIQRTQPKEWKRFLLQNKVNPERKFCLAFNNACDMDGLISVLRHGFKHRGIPFKVCYFKPESGLNQTAEALYEKNEITCNRQWFYSSDTHNSVDMVLSVNGIPVFALELKNQYTGQNVDNAKRQWMYDRDPREICFQFNKRILGYFCIDQLEVWMTTRLEGKNTYFLPFNQGSNGAGNDGGKGNPANPDGYPTSYFWEYVFQKDSMMDIIQKFIHLQVKEEKKQMPDGSEQVTKKKRLIFPRYHQMDVVRKLIADVKKEGAGRNYLIQHSAGSGKSNSIAWTAYRLASLHDSNDESVFSSVVVVTDRTVLDEQLQETISGFDHTIGSVETIDDKKNSKDLRDAINNGARIIVTTLQKFPVIYQEVDKVAGRNFAIIVDEAHSSQTGSSAMKLKAALADTEAALREYAEIEGKAEDEIDRNDKLVQEMLTHGKHPNLSFFAFTATPKPATLEMFGSQWTDGSFHPFHIYSMRQAIEEGFILDVLQNYMTYSTCFKIAKDTPENPELPESRATKIIKKYEKLHPYNISQKSQIIVETFRETTKQKIGGKGKMMVVTDSRLAAVRYFHEIKRYIREQHYADMDILAAFSGTVQDGDEEYTEAGLNVRKDGSHISESQTNASPECFLQKVEDTSWQTIELTGNFRSSQNICNVTSYFSASLRGTKSNNAIGYWKDEVQKPILLLTKNNSENDTIDYFIKKCMEMQIGISPKNVAVLTRGRIYSDTDIKGLWKSAEIELYAKAAYEWKYGSRKKAYENTEKATYCMIFNEDTDKYMMQQKIREHTTEESWKDFIINILINIPDVDMEIAEWVKEFSTIFVDVCKNCEYKISPDKEIKDTFKIKRNDNKSPDFKKISLKKFFEKKNEEKYTRSSIHGVKGESYEAVLLHVKSRTGSTITPKLLMEGELEQELMRLAYVAMTRPRRLLMLAMPDTKGIKTCGRFSEELWTYENL